MDSDVLNELFDSIGILDENNLEGYSVKELIELIKKHKYYDVFLEAMADVRNDLFINDEIHGIAHNERVALYSCAIGILQGLNEKELRLLLEAAKYHDIGRNDTSGATKEHGLRSAIKIEEIREELFPGFSDDDINVIKALCVGHNAQDSEMDRVISENNVSDIDSCKRILTILKDADALDRVRLSYYGKLKVELLRTEEARAMVSTAEKLYEQYNVARETAKYNRDSVHRPMAVELFDMNSYSVIEDDENYYVFRTLNNSNEDELDDDYEMYLRTSRERTERKGDAVKYSADSEISLSEIYDNIKFTNGNKDTNCISFSTNANVSLDYRNDRFVMLKVPKAEMGNLYISGKYMLEEIDKLVEDKISELLEDEDKNKEILALITQVNDSKTSSEMKTVVSRSYKRVRDKKEKYTGSRNSLLTKSAIMNRFANKQYLNEEQQLEYNRLIAKLTILETRGKIGSILPTQLTNTALLSSIGIAFSSSEMIHYKEVAKENLIEVSKENMEMFAILQQAEKVPGVDKEEIEELKRDFLDAIQSGYELRISEGRVVFSNGSHKIDLGRRIDFKGIFEEQDVKDNTPIEDAYQVLRKNDELDKVIPYVKGKAAIDFSRKLAMAKLKKDEYWRVISRISPGFNETIQIASRATITTNPEIISRLNNSGVQLIESINIDIPNLNLRRLFSQEEIEAIWKKINLLSENDLKKILSEEFDFIKDGFFDNVIEGKEYPQGENEYYSELIVDALDLTRVYNYLKPGSRKISQVKEAIREKLDVVDAKKLYLALYKNGFSEEEIPNYITNLILDDGIGKDIDSFEALVEREDIVEVISQYKENLKSKVSAIRLNMFLGIKDNAYVVDGTKIKLRDYQKEALDNVEKIYEKDKRFAGVKLPTGAGKSFVAMAEMMKRKKESMVYFAPQEEILSQVQRHIVKYILDKEILNERHIDKLINMSIDERKVFLENKIYNPTVDINRLLNSLKSGKLTEEDAERVRNKILPRRTEVADDIMDAIHTVFPHLDMCCYQSLTATKYKELVEKKIDFVVFDELHRTGADKWKEQIKKLLEVQEDAKILGITATPVRDVDGIDMMEEMAKTYGGYTAEEVINKEYYAAEMSLIDAMQRKIVVEPIIVPFNSNLKDLPEYQEISEAVKQLEETGSNPKLLQKLKFNLSQMDEIIGQNAVISRNDELIGIEHVLANNISESKKNGRFIVFIPQKPSSFKGTTEEYVKDKIAETSKYFEGVNREMMIQYLLSNRTGGDKENTKAISEFENLDDDRLKLLYAINKLNEGVHVDGISGEVMLRPIGAGSNILYFQQIGRVIYAIDPDNPPSEDDIPIVFDVYNNYIARDLDKEANYSTTISDLSRLQEIVNWINRHESLPDIDSDEKNEVNRALFLRKIQKKYAKYLEGIDNPNLTASEIYEIQKILELGKSFDLFEIEFANRSVEDDLMDLRVRTFEVVGEQKRFLEIYEDSKRAINKSALRNKATDQIKIRDGVGIFKVLSSYGIAITDESFEKINENKKNVNLFEYVTKNFDVQTSREIFNELKISALDAEDVEIYQVFDYLRNSFMSPKSNVRNYFNYYDITDLRKCGILKQDGKYIPVINQNGFVLSEDPFHDGFKSPKDFVNLNIMTGTRYDEDGYDINGYDIDGYNRSGYDNKGYDRQGFRIGDEYNRNGFDRAGIHKDTKTHLDSNNFDIRGYYWKANPNFPSDQSRRINTNEKLNEYNFDINGNYYELNENGEWENKGKRDRYGFTLGQEINNEGFYRNGIYEKTGEYWDEYYFGIDKFYWEPDSKNQGKRIKTDSKLNEYHFDREGYYHKLDENGEWIRAGKIDPYGFRFKDEFNKYGFRRNRINKETGQFWDQNGFDIDGYYWRIDYKTGLREKTDRTLDMDNFDRDGFYWKQNENGEWERRGKKNEQGFRQGEIVDKNGFRRDGIHNVTNQLWDEYGYDIEKKYWAKTGNDDERIPTGDIVNEYGFTRDEVYCEKDEDGNWIEIGLEDRKGFRFGEIVNSRGFRRDDINEVTSKLWDKNGYDIYGIYWRPDPENPEQRIKTDSILDDYGFNHTLHYCEYDEKGKLVELDDRDPQGFSYGDLGTNRDGFYRNGIHSKTGRKFNRFYFDIEGNYWEADPEDVLNDDKRRKTSRKYDEYGKDAKGAAVAGVEQKEEDQFGFRRGENVNLKGFDRNGIYVKTGKMWNPKFFGVDGYYWAAIDGNEDERYKTDRKFNEKNIDNGGYFCIQDDYGRSVRLHKYRNKFWEVVQKQEYTERKDVVEFEDGAYDSQGFWWDYDKATGKYTPTKSKYHPIKGWDRQGMNHKGQHISHDIYGFRPNGLHLNGKYEDDRGFYRDYKHSRTRELYDEDFFDIEGFYWELDEINNVRIKTNSKYNELGLTCDGECEEDLQGYDDIGMQNGTININDKFKRGFERVYYAREGEQEKIFRKTDNGYYYLDSNMKYNPNDGLDYYGYAPNGYNKNGECNLLSSRTYKILKPEHDEYLETYDEVDEVEEYEYEYNPNSVKRRRESILLERRRALSGLSEENINNIRSNRLRYRKHYAPARLEAAQHIRDIWNVDDRDMLDENGNLIVDDWEIDTDWNDEKRWEDYLKKEELLSQILKDEIELDSHGFDSSGMYYRISNISGQDVAEPTGLEYDTNHFDKEGFYWIVDEETGEAFSTLKKWNENGFDQNGFYHNPETGIAVSLYNPMGYDMYGFDRNGFNARGLARSGGSINLNGFTIDGTCPKNNNLRHNKSGFTKDGINIYTGTYQDIFGRTIDIADNVYDAENIVDTEKNLNAYGINPRNGKNEYGYVDPTIRFARYYFSEILEDGREPQELIKSLAGAYHIDEEEMKLLADQKIFVALSSYPKIRLEIQRYFEKGRIKIGKNYDMHQKIVDEHAKRKSERAKKLSQKVEEQAGQMQQEDGTGMDDDL